MATDIIARGMAANAKKSVTELGDKVEGEKWIGTKAEWEAVDKSTIKDGTIVYITDDETVILYDKAEMEKIAAQVAADRKAAETAAQTAQSIADSLPEDYTTAVGKIAENTAEIANVKLTDKELQRRVNALYSIGQGITHQFETDTDTAYTKAVPTGVKLMSVKSVGGRSITFNQMYKKFDYVSGGTLNCKPIFKSHKYLLRVDYSVSENTKVYLYFRDAKYTAETNRQITKDVAAGSGKISWITSPLGEHSDGGDFGVFRMVTDSDGSRKLDTSPFSNYEIFDLTTMFGSGNEPSTVEEFEAMFPNEYYPYNAGEVVSAGTESIIEQGKNLFDYTDKTYNGANISKVENGVIYTKGLTTTVLNIPTVVGSKYTLSFKVKSSGANQGGLRWSLQKGKNTSYAHDSSLIKSEVGYAANAEYQAVATFVATTDFVSLCTIMLMVYDVQLENGDIATDYSPYYQTGYPIPDAIKALPGYGWSAGTARNYVDYENKRYVQCVQSVDLGTLEWLLDGNNWWYNTKISKGLSDSNAICNKRTYVLKGDTGNETQWCHSGGGYFEVYVTDVTTSADVSKKLSGVILYYELATPIVTDISSLIPDDFLRNMEVEAGGSATFKNSNDNYRIPVPSEEEYVVKLSEVGGTT